MTWSFTQDRNKIKKQSMHCQWLLTKVFFNTLIKNISCIEIFFYKTIFVEILSQEKSSEIPFALKKVVKEIFS
jgi:hypothetical protein